MFLKHRIQLGKGYVDRWTLFENKQIGGIYFHHWKTIEQDRFHTHAFDAIAWLIWGSYEEETLDNNIRILKTVKPGIRFIPKNHNHRILKAKPYTFSFLFAGPWEETWTEETVFWKRTLDWNRKIIEQCWKQENNNNE